MIKKALFTLVAIGMLMSNNTAFAQVRSASQMKMTPRQAMYHYAKTGNKAGLRSLVQRGYKLDINDAKGNSSLCEAVWRGDKTAVNTLMSVGANASSDCMKKIPQNYKTQVGLSQPAQAVPVASTATGAGLSTGAMVGIGVGAAVLVGGGVALAAGGGGGGGGSKAPDCSGRGTKDETGVCVCNTGYSGDNCETCASGFGLYGTNECYATKACVNGTQQGANCVCQTGYTGELCNECASGYGNYGTSQCYATKACVNGTQQGANCVCTNNTFTGALCDQCASGYGFYGTTTCHTTLACVDGSQQGANCSCNGHSSGILCDSCEDGYDFYGTTTCYATLACVNGTQQGANCVCATTGWTGNLCDTANACTGYDYTTCPTGYAQSSTCLSGDTTKLQCNNCAEGYGKYGTDVCYATMTCGTNEHQQGDQCVCDTGYEKVGGVCTFTSCPANQYKSGSECLSCPANSTSPAGSTSINQCTCNSGYTKSGNICVDSNLTTGSVYKLGNLQSGRNFTLNEDISIVSANPIGYDAINVNGGSFINNATISANSVVHHFAETTEEGDYGFCAIHLSGQNSTTTNYGTVNGISIVDYGIFDNDGTISLEFNSNNFDLNDASSESDLHSRWTGAIVLQNGTIINRRTISVENTIGITASSGYDRTIRNYGNINVNNGFGIYANTRYANIDIVNTGNISVIATPILRQSVAGMNLYKSIAVGIDINTGVDDKIYTIVNSGNISTQTNSISDETGVFVSPEVAIQLQTSNSNSLFTNTESGTISSSTDDTIRMYGGRFENYGNVSGETAIAALYQSEPEIETFVYNNGSINATLYGANLRNTDFNNAGTVTVTNTANSLYGIDIFNEDTATIATNDITNSGSINVTSTNSTYNNYGIHAYSATPNSALNITNSGSIIITANGAENNDNYDTKIVGIYAENYGNTAAINVINTATGSISVNSNSNDVELYGIYAIGEKTIVENYGNISVSSGTGIYISEGSIYNEGTITLDNGAEDTYCSTHSCWYGNTSEFGYGYYKNRVYHPEGPGYTYSDFVVEKPSGTVFLANGATLMNSGSYISSQALTLSPQLILAQNGQFISDVSISGTGSVDSTAVQNGFNTQYVLENAFISPDTTGLNLISNSAMFNARLADNGSDIIMQMKSFDELTGNKSLASFLANNYSLGNNEAFFNDLKQIGSASAFTSTLNSLTGIDTVSRFAYEDLSAVREINFAMNEQMFANDDKPLFETQGSLNGFSFKNDNHSSASYALAQKRITPRMKIGYAMSNTTLNTDDSNDTTRSNQMFQVFMPVGYNQNGWKMIATPQIGFARGHYTRSGYNDGSYKGTLEKRMFALMNEARYPVEFAGMTLEPTVEFNAITYNQRGNEDAKAYSLTIPSDNNVSVEGGLGLYAKRDIGKLKLNAGLMMYREFADPYNIKLGMQGMEGSFNLYDDKRSEYRGVASFGFGYELGSVNMYGTFQHFMEADTHTTIKTGLKVGF